MKHSTLRWGWPVGWPDERTAWSSQHHSLIVDLVCDLRLTYGRRRTTRDELAVSLSDQSVGSCAVVGTNLVFYPSTVFWALLILPFLGLLCTVFCGIPVSFVFPKQASDARFLFVHFLERIT